MTLIDQPSESVIENTAIAALDLGSNSFHLIVTDDEGRPLVTAKESVRLAAGLDEEGLVDTETRKKTLDTLNDFRNIINTYSPQIVRAVGTSTFRRINDHDFIKEAEKTLGMRIHIISGESEARYIYRGASLELTNKSERRLIVDIGGGSTELAIGRGKKLFEIDSIETGCVRETRNHIINGCIEENELKLLFKRGKSLFRTYEERFGLDQRDAVYGTSGTIRAVYSVLEATEKAEDNVITAKALDALASEIASYNHVDELAAIPSLSERRRIVFPAGITILKSIFTALNIDELTTIRGALREGLIDELICKQRQKSSSE